MSGMFEIPAPCILGGECPSQDCWTGCRRRIERLSIEDALENDRCGICLSVDHFREDCLWK